MTVISWIWLHGERKLRFHGNLEYLKQGCLHRKRARGQNALQGAKHMILLFYLSGVAPARADKRDFEGQALK